MMTTFLTALLFCGMVSAALLVGFFAFAGFYVFIVDSDVPALIIAAIASPISAALFYAVWRHI